MSGQRHGLGFTVTPLAALSVVFAAAHARRLVTLRAGAPEGWSPVIRFETK